MEYIDYIKTIEVSDDKVIDLMTDYLQNNRGFAEKVCDLLKKYWYDWGCELIDIYEEWVDEVGEKTDNCDYEVYDDGDILKTTYSITSKPQDVFDKYADDWEYELSFLADKDDYHYNLYYKMVDWNCDCIRNSAPLIIEHYIKYKLNIK